MAHRDGMGRTAWEPKTQELVRVIEWLLSQADFGTLRAPKDGRWSFRGLVILAVLWAWSGEATLTGRFAAVLRLAGRLWPSDVPQPISYQAFLKRLVRWTEPLLSAWQPVLRRRMRQSLSAHWRIAGRCVFGVDGSKLELPRTRSNEARFSAAAARPGRPTRRSRTASRQSAAARQKKASSPQLWVTTLWHAGSGLPWDWRLGAADSSEREHLEEMIGRLPPQALLAADAGFVGYPLWAALQAAGHDLLVRVGGNVRLLKQLGYARESAQTVYLWPEKAARRRQPPLVLRLVVVQGTRHPWYLVTSVRSPRQLSDRRIVEIYRRRWGLELFHRHFKQTFARRKLRSHTAEHVLCEAHWSLVGLWAMLLSAEVHQQRWQIPPRRLSVAAALRAFRGLLTNPDGLGAGGPGFREALRTAVVDEYTRRSKTSRNYPRKKSHSPCRPPRITTATNQQHRSAQQLRAHHKTGLTA